ncbi:MAG TPA: GatB/YqeY domain-containing protein [Candidatus Moranbacteria bacterium]|nr:GatB/YqeY domain-containing protein [Candidatus Moranbacteria bacterium]
MLKQKIVEDLKTAMKEGNAFKRDTLRMLDSMIKNAEIEKKKKEEGLKDEEIQEVVVRAIKQRKDSMAQYESGGRSDLAEKEKKEIEILTAYMPEQMSEEVVREEVKKIISELGIGGSNEMGKAMGAIMGRLKGKADGQLIRKIVEEELKK